MAYILLVEVFWIPPPPPPYIDVHVGFGVSFSQFIPLHFATKYKTYRQLRARRVLMLLNTVLLRSRRALLLYNVYGDNVLNRTSLNSDSALLVLNRTSLNSDNALLVLNRTSLNSDNALLVLNRTSLNSDNALLVLNRTSLNSDNALLVLSWWCRVYLTCQSTNIFTMENKLMKISTQISWCKCLHGTCTCNDKSIKNVYIKYPCHNSPMFHLKTQRFIKTHLIMPCEKLPSPRQEFDDVCCEGASTSIKLKINFITQSSS